MKKRTSSRGWLWIVMLVSIAAPVLANDWKVLFDGNSLNNWTQNPKDKCFNVVDGEIVGSMMLNDGTSFLLSNQEFADFELELEVNIMTTGLNSGIQIRSKRKGSNQSAALYGPQVELSTKGDKTRSGFIFGFGWGGWITPKETEGHSFMKREEWNKIRVLAVGKSVKTWINGNFVIEQVIPDERHATNPSGYIGFQCADKHGIKPDATYQVAFRNIRVKIINDN